MRRPQASVRCGRRILKDLNCSIETELRRFDGDDARVHKFFHCKRICDGKVSVLFALVAHDMRFNSLS
jgi:hypothetical protein